MKAGNDVCQHPKEPLPVLVIQKDVLPGVALGGGVVDRAGKFDAQRAGRETTSFSDTTTTTG